jgi:hypothetical protein
MHDQRNDTMYQPLDPASDNYAPRLSIQSLPKRKWWTSRNLLAVHNKQISIACLLTLMPMLGLSILLLGLVFDKNIKLNNCPYPELCRSVNSMDLLRGHNYYVDYPVGRLAFISSLSATIGFVCVALLMTLYAFITARQFLDARDISNSVENYPTPHEITLIIRLLDAEISLLLEFATHFFRRITFCSRNATDKADVRKSRAVHACLGTFILCLLGGYVGSEQHPAKR